MALVFSLCFPFFLGNRRKNCVESTGSEERAHWVLRETRWVRLGTKIIGWEELTELSPRNSVRTKKLTELSVLSETEIRHVFLFFPKTILLNNALDPTRSRDNPGKLFMLMGSFAPIFCNATRGPGIWRVTTQLTSPEQGERQKTKQIRPEFSGRKFSKTKASAEIRGGIFLIKDYLMDLLGPFSALEETKEKIYLQIHSKIQIRIWEFLRPKSTVEGSGLEAFLNV